MHKLQLVGTRNVINSYKLDLTSRHDLNWKILLVNSTNQQLFMTNICILAVDL